MRYIDVYPGCNGCPVEKYCGTMVGSIKLCNSYKEPSSTSMLAISSKKEEPTPDEIAEYYLDLQANYK